MADTTRAGAIMTVRYRVTVVAVPTGMTARVSIMMTPVATVPTTMIARVATGRGRITNKIITDLILSNREGARSIS